MRSGSSQFVVEVKYSQRTPDGRLRFPRLLRLRPDRTRGMSTMPADRPRVGSRRGAGALQPGQGAVSGGRVHQGRSDRLLHPDRPGAAAAPAGPAADPDPLPERSRWHPSFFEKNVPAATPDWVRLEPLPAPGSTKGRETMDYVVADDLPTLVWLANLAALELHTPQWNSVGPGLLVIDLDPGPPAGLFECCQAAMLIRIGSPTTGSRAIPRRPARRVCSCCCPVAAPQSAEEVSAYARRVAEELARGRLRS